MCARLLASHRRTAVFFRPSMSEESPFRVTAVSTGRSTTNHAVTVLANSDGCSAAADSPTVSEVSADGVV